MPTHSHPSPDQQHDAIGGKVVYLLIVVTLLQTLYPLTTNSSTPMLIFFQFCYLFMMAGSVFIAQRHRRMQIALTIVGLLWLCAGVYYAFNTDAQWANLSTYGLLTLFQIMVVYVLVHYIFSARVVTRDVIFAACTVYILLGAIFVPIYGIIESLSWFSAEPTHAFIDGTLLNPDLPIQWQTFVYYSYSTLTTLGYGDVLPITPWARSVSSIEAVVGVLYLAILMARLVGLYAANEVEEEFENGG